jgi:hypothetical protein
VKIAELTSDLSGTNIDDRHTRHERCRAKVTDDEQVQVAKPPSGKRYITTTSVASSVLCLPPPPVPAGLQSNTFSLQMFVSLLVIHPSIITSNLSLLIFVLQSPALCLRIMVISTMCSSSAVQQWNIGSLAYRFVMFLLSVAVASITQISSVPAVSPVSSTRPLDSSPHMFSVDSNTGVQHCLY